MLSRGDPHQQAGTRGPEIPKRKPFGEIRILVLGGSSTFNSNSERGQTWPALLEKRLLQKFGSGIRVMNAGTPGYSNFHSVRRLRCELLAFSPVFDELTRWSQLLTRLRFALIKLIRHFRKVSDEDREKDNLDLRIHPNGVRFYRNNLLKIRSLLAGRKTP